MLLYIYRHYQDSILLIFTLKFTYVIINLELSGCSADGSVPAWGAGGRKFKSCHSDQ